MIGLAYIIIGGIALVLIIATTLFILRGLKGSIEIMPEKTSYAAGEIIKGRLILKIRKHVKSKKLIMGLKCERILKTYSHDKKHNIENEDVLFDFNQLLDKEKEYVTSDYSYDFSIIIPLNIRQQLEGIAGTIINSVQALAGQSSSVRWYIYAKLDCEGVDLSKKVQINIA
jgi:hypothetical protein